MRRPPIKVNAMSYAKLVAAVVASPSTVHDLAEETGLHHLTVASHIQAMRRERLVHISAWEKDTLGRDAIAVWQWGHGRDRPRGRLTGAQRSAAYAERLRQRELVHRMAAALPQSREAVEHV